MADSLPKEFLDDVAITVEGVMQLLQFAEVVDLAVTNGSQFESQWFIDGEPSDPAETHLETIRRIPLYDLVENGLYESRSKLNNFFLKHHGFDPSHLRGGSLLSQMIIRDMNGQDPTDYTLAYTFLSYAAQLQKYLHARIDHPVAAVAKAELGRTLDMVCEAYVMTRKETPEMVASDSIVPLTAFRSAVEAQAMDESPIFIPRMDMFEFPMARQLVGKYFSAHRDLTKYDSQAIKDLDAPFKKTIDDGVRLRLGHRKERADSLDL